jgi:hypothetical protein
MSFKRSILVAIATMITVGMTQVAFAGCCDWGGQAPVAYAQTGCGGCGTVAYAPVIYATPIAPAPIAVGTGCGNCGAPVTCCAFAQPVAPVAQWGGGCGGCGAQAVYGGVAGYGGGYNGGGYSGCGNCGVPAVYTTPAPLYVVNQGPAFEGPGVMVPFHSYAPPAQYAPPPAYPPYADAPEEGYEGGYAGGYGGGYARPYPMHRYYPHVAYGGGYYHPHVMAPHYGARPYMMHRPYWRG